MVDFILSNLDKSRAVLLSFVDFSKAYNRQSHNRLLTCYSDLGTPAFLLKILKSYLTKRKIVVRHKGVLSEVFDTPGGGAQGTNIGILSFLVTVNSCGVPLDKMMNCLEHEHAEKYVGLPTEADQEPPIHSLGWTKLCHPVLPVPDPHISEYESRFKYIDDNVMAEAINIKELKPILEDLERPLNYRDRTLHQRPPGDSQLQTRLKEMDKFCDVQQIKINQKKTKRKTTEADPGPNFQSQKG